MTDLFNYRYPDGQWFGIGTLAELATLKAEGVADATVTAHTITAEELAEIMA